MTTLETEKFFNIQIAAKLSGLSAHTIRAWEKRYQALEPARSSTGRRMYSSSEVDRLLLLSQLTNFGSSISQIAHLPDVDLRQIHDKITHTKQAFSFLPSAETTHFDIEISKRQLLEAVTQYKVDVISRLLEKAKSSLKPKHLAISILQPLITEVTNNLESGKLHSAQARALFAIVKSQIGSIIYATYEKNHKSSHRIVLATFENESYNLDLLLSALMCCEHQKTFFYLSSNLPAPSIVDAMKATNSGILILSLPKSTQIKTLEGLLHSLPPAVSVYLVGDHGQDEKELNFGKNVKRFKSATELDVVLASI